MYLQLQFKPLISLILEIALRYFARASTFFTLNCDHVRHTLSSLALSVFELLLFFDHKDFCQEPLNRFTVAFQECYSVLARHQNVHLLQVERLVRGGGPWAGPALQAILSESSLPQSEVDGCISSELPVFFELRVRYLLSCERVSEAMALAGCCARHPPAGQHLFFLQVYLTWLFKTSQQDRLHKEVAEFNGKDAIHIICSLECEEKDELLLALSRAFLSQQLRRGDMYHLCDLVFIWSKLHSRLNTSKQALLEESHQLMLSATNVNSIFPFIRALLEELGEDGIQFCVELCANALGSCLPCDVITKSLIYKTITSLLPNDLEVFRACALLIFFLERTVETYKLVYLLYMHPDQEYHVEYSPIRNHVRFETLQVLKKDLYFDPEFWNLIALRTNCLKLMSEKVVSVPRTLQTTSTCSLVADVQGKEEETQEFDPEAPEDGDLPESEESKLEFCCTFCNKVFKGSRVVEHAMFHYRKDECMFCGTMFKDDLLAMMHLSDHIEKLKRLKELEGNNVQETKDISTCKTSVKAKTTNLSSERRSSGRSRTSTDCPKSTSTPHSSPSGSRQLRSNDKPVDEKKQNVSKHLDSQTPVHKVNGHIGKKKGLEPQENVCCPVEGCSWFKDRSKKGVALLYHALEDHDGEVQPLEVAFRVGHGKCSSCMRVMWSFEHFQHHVDRHRLSPRHPCPHQGCTSRFKTGIEMRRHARRHSPLQAVCCVPGCSQLFICLWALNLHEREHYASKPTKPDKNANEPTNAPNGKKQPVKKRSTSKESPTASSDSKSKSGAQPVAARAAADCSLDAKGGATDATLSSVPAATASGSNDTEENTQKVTQRGESKNPHITKKSDPNGASEKRKNGEKKDGEKKDGEKKDGEKKDGEKKHADQGARPASERPENPKASEVKDALAGYGNRPYKRPPPTAYLAEKYITMPKRRKELSGHQSPQKSTLPPESRATKTPQRRRCANCFATFNSAEELQSHHQLQKCSNLFGFDSDDEEIVSSAFYSE
uniref:C2H2-type domain-containing protein n=1 Tax=Cyclopterus lumpus TaxID=8103 RepID=A0A8C2ZJ48_CYCLU